MNAGKLLFTITSAVFCIFQVPAAELVYRPINPNFGGDPFNAAPLLSNASAQDSTAPAREIPSSAESFAQSLDRSLLNALARDLVSQAFGEDAISDGTFDTGINIIDIKSGLDSTTVTITDKATGDVTVIDVPYF